MKINEYEYPELRAIALCIETGYALSTNECENIEDGGSF